MLLSLVQRGGLSPERVLAVGCDALTGLVFAHKKGVIHRDIKPSNLFVCEDGTTKPARLWDRKGG